MAIPAESESSVHFGEFKLDLRTRELRCNGHTSYLQEQPFQVLAVLLDRPRPVGHPRRTDETVVALGHFRRFRP